MSAPNGLLAAMVAAARRAADERARLPGVREVEWEAATRHPGAARFREALMRTDKGPRILAECKRRSPSRGVLRREYDAPAIARGYETAGAAAISVLTEPAFFDGSLDDLRAVRAAVAVPLLRKDFIVTDFQMLEARGAGADAVLLIAGALNDDELARLLARSAEHQLAALVEVHDEAELSRAIDAGARIIGVNSRDLRTLEVKLAVFDRLAELLPADVVAVAESGIRTAADVTRLHALRYDAFLIGERFMTAAAPGEALAALLAGVNAGATR